MKPGRLVMGAASVIVLGTIASCGLVAAALLQMLHIPRRSVADVPQAKVVEIHTADRTRLEAAWVTAGEGKDCVLVLHGAGGWRGRSHRFLPWLTSAGYSVLAPDLRGHGESGGDTITYGILETQDTLAWVAWLREHSCTHIYGMGESLGASILIMTAALDPDHPPFAAIVAEAPFADLLEAAGQRAQRLFPLPESASAALASLAVAGGNLYTRMAEGLDFHQSSPIASIRKLRTPVLLIHGLADNRTPPSHSRELAAANPQFTQLWLVPDARHVGSYTTAPSEYRERVIQLFAQAK